MTQLVTGTFETASEADEAIEELIDAGFMRDEISVMMSDLTRTGMPDPAAIKRAQGAEIARDAAGGGMIGGTLGAIVAAALAATGAIGAAVVTGGAAMPFIAGPLVATLAGGGAGAAAGSVIGALAGLGVSQEEAARYENAIRAGNILVAVEVDDAEVEDAEAILQPFTLARS